MNELSNIEIWVSAGENGSGQKFVKWFNLWSRSSLLAKSLSGSVIIRMVVDRVSVKPASGLVIRANVRQLMIASFTFGRNQNLVHRL